MNKFVKKVKREMVRQDLNITQLAEACNVGRTYLSNVLAGKHTPTIEWAEGVADYLGFSIEIKCPRKSA